MRKPKVIHEISIGERRIEITKKKKFFGGTELAVCENGKIHTKLAYKVEKGLGNIEAAGFRYKISLPQDLRGNGIYAFMVDHALEDMKNNGAHTIHIDLLPDLDSKEKLFEFYKKRGFFHQKDIPLSISNTTDTLMNSVQPSLSIQRWAWPKNE